MTSLNPLPDVLSGNRWTGSVRLPGRAVESRSPYLLDISPGFFDTMGIARIDAGPQAIALTFRTGAAEKLSLQEKIEVSLYPQLRYDYLLKVWLSAHIPLSAGMWAFSTIHIISVLYY